MIICVWACVFFRVHVGQSTRSFVRVARVMCIVLSSPCCIHSLSHRSVYRWVCNYVPQWSSLCFFTAQELSRQRSVCAPWKLPSENHMAMRAIMDFFFSPSQDPSLSLVLFLSVFLLLSMNIWADVNRCMLPAATSVFVLQQPHKLSLLYSPVILEVLADTGAHSHTAKVLRISEKVC